MDGEHVIGEAYATMLIQLAQGESDVMDQVAGLPPTLPAGPEMAAEALTIMKPSLHHSERLRSP